MSEPKFSSPAGPGRWAAASWSVSRRPAPVCRVLSRSERPGTVQGDLLTGEGLEAGRRRRRHDSPLRLQPLPQGPPDWTWRERSACSQVAARAGVSHLVYISIVGIDRVQSYPYYRVKLEAERVVEGSPVPHTILRATQFYDLVLMAVRALARLPVVLVPKGLSGQPIDTGEVADRMVELRSRAPAGRVPDIGGPEVRTVTTRCAPTSR